MDDLTPAQLIIACQEAAKLFPGCVLVKNRVGNLAVVLAGDYVGFIDLKTGEVVDLR
jgi:hypothetical protein